MKWHRRLARKAGYDLEKFNKQLTLESHLRRLMPGLGIDLVFDVGANEGQFASMLRLVGYRGEIISFEPTRATFAIVEKAAAADPLWKVLRLALTDVDGVAELNVSGRSEFNSLQKMNEVGVLKFGARAEVNGVELVETARLERLIPEVAPEFATKNSFLKMDTQGHDLKVFEGAGAYRDRFSLLQSEVSVVHIYDDTPDHLQILDHYRSFGYELTGMYPVNRTHGIGHVIDFDCVMAPLPGLRQDTGGRDG